MSPESDSAKVRFFPPGIPLLTILLGAAVHWFIPIDLGLPTLPLRIVGIAISLGATLILGLWSVILFRKGGQSENPWKPTPKIETSGPYKFTRNPMYLQMVLICLGVGLAFQNPWTLCLTPLAAWALQKLAIEPEEAYLEKKFGDSYREYKQRVRRWI